MAEFVRVRKKHLQAPIKRLRIMMKQLDKAEVDFEDMKKNLEYTASLLEAVYIDENRQILDIEDDLQQLRSDTVHSEVRDWLSSTFTHKALSPGKRSDEKRTFRSIVHVVQAGIFVERMFKKAYSAAIPNQSSAVLHCLRNVDRWNFDMFALNSACRECSLRTVVIELLTRYELNSHFKIPIAFLISFLDALESGYNKHRNPYHSQVHAADITQTVHCLLLRTGLVNWLSELEILAVLFAAAIHDFEHTGTTNPFHMQTRSDYAMIYNDRSVLESHHVSAAFRLMQDDERNIFINLSREEWSFLWRESSRGLEWNQAHITAELRNFRSTWTRYTQQNKLKWKERAATKSADQSSIKELSSGEEDFSEDDAVELRHKD
ncbi:UNVERIFIED_CONTAM: hypothetical protein FKN15_062156 [Acipenser sinensis]